MSFRFGVTNFETTAVEFSFSFLVDTHVALDFGLKWIMKLKFELYQIFFKN